MGVLAHFLLRSKEVSDVADAVTAITEAATPLAAAVGLDLVEVDVKGTGPRTLVRVTVDRKGGVDLATCQQVAGALAARLDEIDPIDSRYQLEVTSPGTDRPLRERRDFERVEGRAVQLQRRNDGERVTEIRGTLERATADGVVIDVDGEAVTVGYSEVVKATQALPW